MRIVDDWEYPLPTVEQVIMLAHDVHQGKPVRVLTDEESSRFGSPLGTDTDTYTDHSPDVFTYDGICTMLLGIGIYAYVEQTGGGCATIYAGPLFDFHHVVWKDGKPTDETEIERRHKVAAGPGHFGWGRGPSVGTVLEFFMGPNDDGGADWSDASDLGVTNTRQLAALIALYVIDAADVDNVEAIGLDPTHRGITPQNGAQS